MSRNNPPMLLEGPLSGRIFIATRYQLVDAARGVYCCQEKYDVTEEFDALATKRLAALPEPAPGDTE